MNLRLSKNQEVKNIEGSLKNVQGDFIKLADGHVIAQDDLLDFHLFSLQQTHFLLW